MEYHSVQDGFVLNVWSTGGTVVAAINGEACSSDKGGAMSYIRKDDGEPVSFPAYGEITVTAQDSTVTFTANGATQTFSVTGFVYAVYVGYLTTGVSDAGPFTPATFSDIAITAGGRTAGVRAWWLSTTQYEFQGLETHVTASDPVDGYSQFGVTRHYDGP